ncbi:MAG: aconitate hydratase AcnA [Ardenticatenaceae bacterium]|nr:aconitate hydratase AcnA [Ardenticatenaceae bacterium]HBY94214.1 aconitate hydratase AcnA [Chloroflexota bacterium]
MSPVQEPFDARTPLETSSGPVQIYRLEALEQAGFGKISRLPFSIKVLLEAALRNVDGFAITEEHVQTLAGWRPDAVSNAEIPFMPSRVILQDFTGVPSIVDLAALRSAMDRLGGDPTRINPQVMADLVIDHSVQVDAFGSLAAIFINAEREFERNRERYEFLHWGQRGFNNFRVVPPASGIVHQVNLEYLGKVVQQREVGGARVAFPDSLVGTDSHTTMINGLGILGWGVGGIEAEAVMLGQPMYMLMPAVVGFKLTGQLPEGATATDLVLRVTEMLREHGVVGKFVEFYGDGLSHLGLADRATIANMSPEYGATCGFFPVDDETLRYLKGTGRPEDLVDLVERYCKAQGLFRTNETPAPEFSETLEFDIGTVKPSLAGPKRPQDRVPLSQAKRAFWQVLSTTYRKKVETDPSEDTAYIRWLGEGGQPAKEWLEPRPRRRDLYRRHRVPVEVNGVETFISHGSVVIAAITSCTNTSNPSVMVGAGLLAKKAVELGLDVKPWVKTSLAPGSRVVTNYLAAAGLTPYLEALRFHTVGYGCTTCIGNSGPLSEPITKAILGNDLVVASVLSGNRNFEGRINPLTKANYLASPPLVVAYALAGTMDIDLASEPLGYDPTGRPIYLSDIWPTQDEIRRTINACLRPEMFTAEYAHIFEGNEIWNQIEARGGILYNWNPQSTYIQEPPFFRGLTPDVPPIQPIHGAGVLALLGDSITTDHISPAGSIPLKSPAGEYLISHGVQPRDFNSYGSRRGNHEVMMRGTFANIRLRNQLAPGTEGGYTTFLPTGEVTTIYDAAMRYQDAGTPLLVLAGKEYGTGSSRDWAAKGTYLLGVKAVIAESFERIHRSNLVGMGVLPLQFLRGEGWRQLGLTGHERYNLDLPETLQPGQRLTVSTTALPEGGGEGVTRQFEVIARVDSPVEVRYYQNGGILHTVLRDMLTESQPA